MPSSMPSDADLLTLLRGVSRSFYLSIRVLPAVLRRPIAVAYLLARTSDTIADSAELAPGVRLRHLDAFGAQVQGQHSAIDAAPMALALEPWVEDASERRLVACLPQTLALLATLDPADQHDTRVLLGHIVQGQRLDLGRFETGDVTAIPTGPDLDEYTWLVAGSVGEFWTRICERHLAAFASLPLTRMQALGRSFGMGLQLVNILRDVGPDLREGRCYLPASELARTRAVPGELIERPEAMGTVWEQWLEVAKARMADGITYANAVQDRRVRLACALPALLGARTLALLEAAGPTGAVRQRVKVPRSQVRGLIARLLLGAVGPGVIDAQFDRLRTLPGVRDNPPA